MILVRLMGGLGNQMFQYATAKALAIRNSTILKIDTTLLELNKKSLHEHTTHRDLDLEVFSLQLERASIQEVEYFNGHAYHHVFGKMWNRCVMLIRAKKLVIEKGRGFNPRVLTLSDNICLVGAWQSENYFKDVEDQIRKEFIFREPALDISRDIKTEIEKGESLCVNVRRGDYVTSPIYSRDIGALKAEYYNSGLDFVMLRIPSVRIFVFSDDIAWCKDNLQASRDITFVDHSHAGNKFGNYLQLMTACKHFIIPNSTFGWWAAWLGEKVGSYIIAPQQWTRQDVQQENRVVPERWHKIINSFENLS